MNKLLLPVLAALLIWGCGKKNETSVPVAEPPKANAAPLEGKVDPQLTALLKQFVAEKGRLPNSFLEFAGAKTDSVPRAPEGYAYQIDAATTEVKLVKQ